MGHASPSRLRDALDLSIADPADSQILDDRAEQKINAPPNETDSAGKDAGNDDATSRIGVIRATAMLEEIIEGESPTVRHHFQPKAARVSWARRLLNWFMSRFGQPDLR